MSTQGHCTFWNLSLITKLQSLWIGVYMIKITWEKSSINFCFQNTITAKNYKHANYKNGVHLCAAGVHRWCPGCAQTRDPAQNLQSTGHLQTARRTAACHTHVSLCQSYITTFIAVPHFSPRLTSNVSTLSRLNIITVVASCDRSNKAVKRIIYV